MPVDQYRALAEEYFRDPLNAELRATVMNASGNYKRHITARDLLGDADPAPPKSNEALRGALRLLGGKRPDA